MPDEYFDMLPRHYYAKIEGYNNRRKHEAEILRQQAFIITSPYLKEGSSYNYFKSVWPLWFDEIIDEKIPELTGEQLKAIKEQHKQIIAKKKKK